MIETLELRDLWVTFGTKSVLRGLNLTIKRGQSMVVIGASGSGKSVLIKSILGLVAPSQGAILCDGQNLLTMNARDQLAVRGQMGLLFQYSALFDFMTIWENIAFRLIYSQKMARHHAKQVALGLMRQVGLAPENAELYPAELSGGMKKRAGLARAVAGNPAVLFFDEPTAGLDPIMGRIIDDLIHEQVRGLGALAITISHDMAEVRRIADQVALIHQGIIVWQGSKAEIDNTDNPYARQFIDGLRMVPLRKQRINAKNEMD